MRVPALSNFHRVALRLRQHRVEWRGVLPKCPLWGLAGLWGPYADVANPQTLNLYAYVGNNPTTRTDADGHGDVPAENGEPRLNIVTCSGCPEVNFIAEAVADQEMSEEQREQVAQQGQEWSLSWQVNASASFLGEELKGVADATITPVVSAVEHPVDTVEGLASAVAHPVDTAEKVVNGAVDTAKAAASGDPRAIGQVAGVVIATAAGVKGAQGAAEEAQGLRGITNRIAEGPRRGEIQHVGVVNNKGNVIHLGREGNSWHVGIGRGGAASGAGAAIHIPLPSWLNKLLN